MIGVKDELFDNLTIIIYPIDAIVWEDGREYQAAGLFGAYWNMEGGLISQISIAMGSNLKLTLYHELGHLVSRKYINNFNCDWQKVNNNGKRYIIMKKYNINKGLSYSEQITLSWEERITEWFAEDTKQVFEKLTGHWGTYRYVGPYMTPDVEQLIKKLILQKEENNKLNEDILI